MPKYRFLEDEELTFFEEEFKQFLIINQVYKEEWTLMNQNNPEMALELVGLFSDQILERVYSKMQFIEVQAKDYCLLFNFKEEEVFLFKLSSSNMQSDFSSSEKIHESLKAFPDSILIQSSSKKLELNRQEEIHQLIEKGAIPSSQEFWDFIEKTVK